MRRIAFAILFTAAAVLPTACFGDNSSGENGPTDPDEPSITEIVGPIEIDTGEELDFTIRVKGQANQQLEVAVSSTLGSFSPPSTMLITNEVGDGSFITRYASGTTGGAATIIASVKDSEGDKMASKDVTVFEVERFGNATPLLTPVLETAGYLIAYPFTLSETRTFTKFGIIAPQAATALVGLYSSTSPPSPEPLALVTKVTATLVVGRNEISIPASVLSAGNYWMAVAYQGTPMVYKGPGQVPGWYALGWDYADGLPDSFTNVVLDNTNLSTRNFYLVLRR